MKLTKDLQRDLKNLPHIEQRVPSDAELKALPPPRLLTWTCLPARANEPMVMSMNHETHLLVLYPLAPLHQLVAGHAQALAWQLERLHVRAEAIDAEMGHVLRATFDRSSDRSITGSLVDLRHMLSAFLEDEPPPEAFADWMRLQDQLNDTPHVKLKEQAFAKDNVRSIYEMPPLPRGLSTLS